ncbi:MAG TPA: copper-binding protein [Thermoanaerobaculia bacterium]|jgi:protein SCO1/2
MNRPAASVLLLLLAIACAGEAKAPKPLSVAGEKLYTVRGKVVARDVGDNTVRLDHEAIPGFMEAMVMDYSLRGADVAQLPANQARIEARLHVTDDGYWLTDVKAIP